MSILRPLLPLLAFPAFALADPAISTVTEGTLDAPPTNWLGEEPHFAMVGTVNGYDFDIYLSDMTRAAGVASYEAKREYQIDGSGLRYVDFEFTLRAVIEAVEKEIELEFENFDFAALRVPVDLTLQSDEFPKGQLSNLEVEFEWEIGGKSVNEEVAAWDGTFTYTLDEGTMSDRGTLQGGKVGGYVSATKGNDSLAISFTAPVTEVEIED